MYVSVCVYACLCAAEENVSTLIDGKLEADGHLTTSFIKFLGILPISRRMGEPVFPVSA